MQVCREKVKSCPARVKKRVGLFAFYESFPIYLHRHFALFSEKPVMTITEIDGMNETATYNCTSRFGASSFGLRKGAWVNIQMEMHVHVDGVEQKTTSTVDMPADMTPYQVNGTVHTVIRVGLFVEEWISVSM